MKNKYFLPVILQVVAIALVSCSKYKDPGSVEFTIDKLDSVDIHTDFQKQYLESEDPDVFVFNNKDDLSYFSKSEPNRTKISYNLKSDNGVSPKEVHVKVSEKQDMSEYMLFDGDEKETEIYNLKTSTTYYYQVNAHYVSDFNSEVKSFTVSNDAPRNIFVEGVENVRDLGGWNIGQGKEYKQGLIYRTAQFNYGGDNKFKSEPTENGLKVLKEDLKIKTEIDLRRTISFDDYDEANSVTISPLGEDVNYVSCPMHFGNQNIFALEENIPSIKLFFETLSDEKNYPVAFHCVRGTDRTGGLAYVLGAMVGMSEADLMRDYLFSNFAKIGSTVRENSITSYYVKGIANSEGETYAEKAKNYLMEKCEVPSTTIDKVVSILVGDK